MTLIQLLGQKYCLSADKEHINLKPVTLLDVGVKSVWKVKFFAGFN